MGKSLSIDSSIEMEEEVILYENSECGAKRLKSGGKTFC